MRQFIALFLAIISGVGIGVGSVFVFRQDSMPALMLEPSVFEYASDDPERGDVASVPLMLRNTGTERMTVTDVSSTCGCTQVFTRDDKPFVTPHEVRADEVLPLIAKIDTTAWRGRSGVSLMVKAVSENRERMTANSVIRMNVRSGWAANPPQLVFRDCKPGQPVEATVSISDSLPGSGIAFKEVISSSTATLQTAVELPRGDAEVAKPETSNLEVDAPFQERVCLKVTFIPSSDTDSGEEWLSIVPSDKKRPVVRIPVFYSLEAPLYRVNPSVIVVSVSDGDRLVRIVRCELRPDAPASVHLLRGPDFASVKVRDDGGQAKEIVVTLTPPKNRAEAELVFAADASEKTAFTIPIRVYRPQ